MHIFRITTTGGSISIVSRLGLTLAMTDTMAQAGSLREADAVPVLPPLPPPMLPSPMPKIAARSACDACPVHEQCFCQTLSGLDVLRLLHPTTLHLPAGAECLRQGEAAPNVLIVREGWVLLYALLGDGRRQVLKFALRGDVLALGVDLSTLPYAAQALTDVTLCVVSRARLLDVCRIHPGLGLDLLEKVSRDSLLAYEHLTRLGRCSARERLARLLLELLHRARLATPDTDAATIPLPLTQTHIGDALGLTAEHTNRMLASLRDDGIIALAKRTLHVLDGERLAAAGGATK